MVGILTQLKDIEEGKLSPVGVAVTAPLSSSTQFEEAQESPGCSMVNIPDVGNMLATTPSSADLNSHPLQQSVSVQRIWVGEQFGQHAALNPSPDKPSSLPGGLTHKSCSSALSYVHSPKELPVSMALLNT